MKRIFSIIAPFLILAFVLYILIGFRHVETLSAEEKQAIERYRQELVKGTITDGRQGEGIFYKEDFDKIAYSLDRLHQHANYVNFGSEWGYLIDNAPEEFANVIAVLNKKEYVSDSKHRDFFNALRADLSEAKATFPSRESHDILDDLSTLVFIEEILDERQWGNPKTIQVMKEKGLVLIKEGSKNTNANASTGD